MRALKLVGGTSCLSPFYATGFALFKTTSALTPLKRKLGEFSLIIKIVWGASPMQAMSTVL
jgi:hypothetical protein